MTTIAYDGEILAADGRVSRGGVIVSETFKKIVKRDCCGTEVLIASCGYARLSFLFIKWVENGMDLDEWEIEDPDEEYEGLVIAGEKVLSFSGDGLVMPFEAPFSIGSGSELALGAMKAGKSAIGAVKIASETDIFTGGITTAYKRTSEGWISIN